MDEERQNPDADGKFTNSVNWNWNDGKLHLDNNFADNANQNFGSASLRRPLRLSSTSPLIPPHFLGREGETGSSPQAMGRDQGEGSLFHRFNPAAGVKTLLLKEGQA